MRLKSILFALCLAVVTACGPMVRTTRQQGAAGSVPATETTRVPAAVSATTATSTSEAQAAADWVWTYSLAHPEGFTVDIRGREVPAEGISVAYAATQDRHSKEDLGVVVSHALAHDGYVGGWWNSEDSLYYFDSVRILPESAAGEAVTFALDMYCPRGKRSGLTMSSIRTSPNPRTSTAGARYSWPAPSTMETARIGSRRSPRSLPGGIGGTCFITLGRKSGIPSARGRWTIRSIGNSSTWKRPTTS